jgi:hypothetical protein
MHVRRRACSKTVMPRMLGVSKQHQVLRSACPLPFVPMRQDMRPERLI